MLNAYILGKDDSFVLRGFEILMTGAVGSSASGAQLIVDEGAILHGKSNISGTFYVVPSGTPNETLNSTTNTKVSGSFTPSSLNYIGIEYIRSVDDSTAAPVYLWNPTSKNEITKNLPLAELLDYQVVISSAVYASNVLPIAIIETDASNNILNVIDRRPMLFRLGTAGTSTPNPFYAYPWTNHVEGRVENFWKSTSATSPFRGGDKQILTEKEWKDAIMSSLLEIKGTPYWYSFNSGGSILKLRLDLANTVISGSGNISHDAAVPGRVNWSSDIFMNLVGSRLSYKISSNAATNHITLADNEVAYINLVRGVDITPNLILTNGSAVVTSVGAVPWTAGLVAGDFVKVASVDDTYYYQIQTVDSVSQVTLTVVYADASTGSSGIQCQYAWGVYSTNAAPATDRHIYVADRASVPFSEDVYWMLLRADNGGGTPAVYVRFMGQELEQGEVVEINDNTSLAVLSYMGSASESDSTPDYLNAITTSVAEVTTFTCVAAAAITTGQYFTINSALDVIEYYVWYNKAAGGGDPTPAGKVSIEVAIGGADTNIQVAAATHAAINALGDFNSVDNLDGTITVTNDDEGVTTDAANVDVGGAFNVNVDTPGTGEYNHYVIDNENLTKGEKRLDSQVFINELAIAGAAATAIQDNNLKLVKGGVWNWDLATTTLSWSATGYIQVPGLQNARNTIVAGSDANLTADGMVLYVTVNRTIGPNANIAVQNGTIGTLSLGDDDFIIARRIGNGVIVGTHSTLLTDRESKELEDDEVYKYHGQLKVRPHLTDDDRFLIAGADKNLFDGTTLGLENNNLLLDFDGAEIDFATGTVYEEDGITGLGVDFVPVVIGANQWQWYSITLIPGTVNADNSIGAQLIILAGAATGATKALAERAPFASGIKIGQVAVKEDGAGGLVPMSQDNVVQMGIGATGGGDDGAGTAFGLQLDELPFWCGFKDTFEDDTLVDDVDAATHTATTASHSIVNKNYEIEYDTDQGAGSITPGSALGAGANITWTGAPAFTLVVGDVLFAKMTVSGNLEVRKIITVNSQTDVDIEAAFSLAPTGVNTDYFGVSQKVQTQDGMFHYDSSENESRPNGELVGHIALTLVDNGAADTVDHSESPAWLTPQVGDIVLKENAGVLYETTISSITDADTFVLANTTGFGGDGDAYIIRPGTQYVMSYYDNGWTGSVNVAHSAITGVDLAANWANEYGYARQQNFADDQLTRTIQGTAGAHFFVRFFANAVTGKGNVIFYEYDSVFYPESDFCNGGIHYQSWARTNGLGIEINCSLSVVGIKSRITLIDDFPSFVPGVNSGKPIGDIQVILDGKDIPRYISAALTPGASYTEDSNGRYIDLDQDYSGDNYPITVRKRIGTIDTSDDNSAKLTLIQDIIVGTAEGCNYASLWDAVDVVVAGQKIIVTSDQVTTIQRDLSKAFSYEIVFKPDVKVDCDTLIADSIIVFGDDIITKNFKLVLSETITNGFEFDGSRSYHENIQVIQDAAGKTLTNGFIINVGEKGNYIRGLAYQSAGTITNDLANNSGNLTNDPVIRAVA